MNEHVGEESPGLVSARRLVNEWTVTGCVSQLRRWNLRVVLVLTQHDVRYEDHQLNTQPAMQTLMHTGQHNTLQTGEGNTHTCLTALFPGPPG